MKTRNRRSPDLRNRALISRDQNRAMFDRLADRYDLMNRIISLGMDGLWRKRTLQLVDPKPGGHYLDAGCGTGDLIVGLARLSGKKRIRITGIDRSEAMLAAGRKKILPWTNLADIRLLSGDAVRPDLPASSVDGIVSGFVFRNLDDRLSALRNWYKILKETGRCVILELSKPSAPVGKIGYFLATRVVIPAASLLLGGIREYRYLVDSIESFPGAEAVVAMMGKAGFTGIEAIPLSAGLVTIYSGIKHGSSGKTGRRAGVENLRELRSLRTRG